MTFPRALKGEVPICAIQNYPYQSDKARTSEGIHNVVEAIIMEKQGGHVLEKSHWVKYSAFTQPKTNAKVIEFLGRPRMTITQ